MNDYMVHAFDVIALIGALMLVFVGRQAMNDLHLRRTDPPNVAKARKLTFYASSAFVLLTVCFQYYWLTAAVAPVVSGYILMSISILSVSLVSMALRKPPDGHRSSSGFLSSLIGKVVEIGRHVFTHHQANRK